MTNPLHNLKQIPYIKVPASTLIFEALREAILLNQLPAGTQLVEAQLAKQFNVSKTPIREALQKLVYSGLADSELAKGVVVHTLTGREIHDLMEMRLVLEPLAVEQSVPNLTQDELDTLRATLEMSRKAIEHDDNQLVSQFNSDFHRGLYAKATNQLLLQWLDSMTDRRQLITIRGWAVENRREREWEEHMAVLVAAEAGDAQGAANCLRKHIISYAETVERNLSTLD